MRQYHWPGAGSFSSGGRYQGESWLEVTRNCVGEAKSAERDNCKSYSTTMGIAFQRNMVAKSVKEAAGP